jgi:hypothetical protein
MQGKWDIFNFSRQNINFHAARVKQVELASHFDSKQCLALPLDFIILLKNA